MKRIILLFLIFNFKSILHSQTVVFIEKNGFVYSDTTSTPAINVLTGEVVRSNDVLKDSLKIEKPFNALPNHPEDLPKSLPFEYLVEPKKK